jgi:hypothetical protein
VLNYGLWVKGDKHIFELVLDKKYDEKKRFENDATKAQGQRRDLQKILPAAYVKKDGSIKNPAFVARLVSSIAS